MFLFWVTQVGPENSDASQPLFAFAHKPNDKFISCPGTAVYHLVINDYDILVSFFTLTPVFVFMALSKSILAWASSFRIFIKTWK